jgi:hypothetical protein
MTAYYRASFDMTPDQWHMGTARDEFGNEIRGYHFRLGRPYTGLPPVRLEIYQDGRPQQVSFGFESMVVVSQQARQAIEPVASGDCEFFPVAIPRMPAPWFVLNATRLLDCFDEINSRFTRNPAKEDGYSIVTRLMVDPARIRGQQLFRVKGWDVPLIVSDAVKAAMETVPQHGVRFVQVTP